MQLLLYFLSLSPSLLLLLWSFRCLFVKLQSSAFGALGWTSLFLRMASRSFTLWSVWETMVFMDNLLSYTSFAPYLAVHRHHFSHLLSISLLTIIAKQVSMQILFPWQRCLILSLHAVWLVIVSCFNGDYLWQWLSLLDSRFTPSERY